jgi:hypothetical protein
LPGSGLPWSLTRSDQPEPPFARGSNAHLFRFDRQRGVDLVAGADEAGRAALAGPLVAAAVLFDDRTIRGREWRLLAELNDSKKISAAVRERVGFENSSPG